MTLSLNEVQLYAVSNAPFWDVTADMRLIGDNHIQKFWFVEVYHCIYGLKFRLTALLAGCRKAKFLTVYPMIYLPKWNFEYSYPLNVLL